MNDRHLSKAIVIWWIVIFGLGPWLVFALGFMLNYGYMRFFVFHGQFLEIPIGAILGALSMQPASVLLYRPFLNTKGRHIVPKKAFIFLTALFFSLATLYVLYSEPGLIKGLLIEKYDHGVEDDFLDSLK